MDQVRQPRSERPPERGPDLLRPGDQFAGAAQRRDHLVIPALGLQVGGDVVAVERLHGMLLQPPDAVVAADHDDPEPAPATPSDTHHPYPPPPVAPPQHTL